MGEKSQYHHTLPCLSVFVPLSPSNSHLATLYSSPPHLSFHSFFSLSVSPLSLFPHSISNHCEIARRLVGDFSDREIWLRSESLASTPAFLSQFKCFCSFTGTPTQTGRHTHINTLQVSRPLFFSCAHAHSFICLVFFFVTYIQAPQFRPRSDGGGAGEVLTRM